MKIKKLISIVSVWALLGGTLAQGNLLENAGFESGVDSWTTGATVTAAAEPVRSGSGSLKLDGTGGNFSVPEAFQVLPAEPGQVFRATGYLLTPEALPQDATFGLLKIVFSDGTQDLPPVNDDYLVGVINNTFPGVESQPFLNADAAANEWVYTAAQGTAPVGTTEVKIFVLNVNQSGAVMYADDLEVLELTNLLANPGFESGVDNWITFNGAAAATVPVRSGTGSLVLDGAGGNFSVPGAFQTFPVMPGEVVNMQGYLLTPDALPEDVTFGLFKIVFSDGTNDLVPVDDGNLIGVINTANPGIESQPFLNAAATPNEWMWSVAQGTAPEGAVSASFFALNVNQSGAVIYADDLQASIVIPADVPTWAGYPLFNEAGDVDTGGFLGFLNVSFGEWVWSYSVSNWLYLPADNVTDSGAWVYILKP